MGSYGTFERLAERCRELGYHGPCPEALELLAPGIEREEESEAVCKEYRRFMAGMRAMFAPK
jgi:hypothetical protein